MDYTYSHVPSTVKLGFKQITKRLLPVRVEAEDFNDAMERGLELIRLHQDQPEALTKRTRSRWGPAVTTLVVDSIA